MVSPLRQSSEQAQQLTPLNVQSAREAGSIGQSFGQGLQAGQGFEINAQQNARANQTQALQARQAQVQTAVEEQRLAELQKRYMFLDTHLNLEAKKSAVDLQVAEGQLRMQAIQDQLAKSRTTAEDVQIQKTVSDMDPWQDEKGNWHMTVAEPGGTARSPVIAPNHPKVLDFEARQKSKLGLEAARTEYWAGRQSGVKYEPTYTNLVDREKLLVNHLQNARGVTDSNSDEFLSAEEQTAMSQELADIRTKLRTMAQPDGADPHTHPPDPPPPPDTTQAHRRPPTSSDQLDVPNETGVPSQRRQAAIWSLAGKRAQTATSLGVAPEALDAVLPRFIKLMRDSQKDLDPVTHEKQSDETVAVRLLDTLSGDGPDSQAMRSMFLKVVGK